MREYAEACERMAYCFLARPDKEFMESMLAMGTADPNAPWYDSFASFAALVNQEGDDAALQALAVDRTRLFKGLTSIGPTPPYQGLFAKGERADTLASLSGRYAAEGFEIPGVHEAPDQLGVELMFAAHLMRTDRDAEAATFLRDNALPLATAFASVLKEHAQTDFFRGYAEVLADFASDMDAIVAEAAAASACA